MTGQPSTAIVAAGQDAMPFPVAPADAAYDMSLAALTHALGNAAEATSYVESQHMQLRAAVTAAALKRIAQIASTG